jgi:hypothetical protein
VARVSGLIVTLDLQSKPLGGASEAVAKMAQPTGEPVEEYECVPITARGYLLKVKN